MRFIVRQTYLSGFCLKPGEIEFLECNGAKAIRVHYLEKASNIKSSFVNKLFMI